MSDFKYKIEGGKELNAALRRLPLNIERNIARAAARAGASVVLKEARRTAPIGIENGGTLKRSLAIVMRSRRVADAMASVVTRSGKKWTPKGMNAWYAGKVEFGVPALGIPARPFMRNALRVKSQEAIQAMAKKITDNFTKLAAKF